MDQMPKGHVKRIRNQRILDTLLVSPKPVVFLKEKMKEPLAQEPLEQKQDKDEAKDEDKKAKDKAKAAVEKVPVFQLLFKYASSTDKLLMALGTISAIANGAALPLMTIIFGDIIDAYGRYPLFISEDEFTRKVNMGVIWHVVLGVGVWVLSYFQLSLWMTSGENQTKVLYSVNFVVIMFNCADCTLD